MPTQKRVGDLEISEDVDFVRKEWIVQRVGWALMAALIIGALLGLFGTGPLSSTTASTDPPSLTVRYSRFTRYVSPTAVQIQVAQQAISGDEVRIRISNQYLNNIQIQHVTPQPDSVESGQEAMVYVFKPLDPNQSLTVTFHIQPQQIGRLPARIGLGDQTPLRFDHFVYP